MNYSIDLKNMRAIIFVLIILSIVGCKKEGEHCPAFPQVMLGYFPYSEVDALEFLNTNNDTLILNISSIRVTDSYIIEPNCKCLCGSVAFFETGDTDYNSIKITGTLHYSIIDSLFRLTCGIVDNWSHDDFELRKIINNPYSVDFLNTFGDTLILESNNYYRFDSVKIIKNKGVVEFWDKECNCEWIISE